MAKLIICKGLPGSGKTTWAREQTHPEDMRPDPRVVRVNRDDIRRQLEGDGPVNFSHGREKEVRLLRNRAIAQALRNPQVTTVISDDTNLHPETVAGLVSLARACDATVEFKLFLADADECIRRDAKREGKAKVGPFAIARMARDHQWPPIEALIERYVPPTAEPSAVICDLDGTLSLFKEKGHRGPFDATLCNQDDCNHTVRRLLEVQYRFMGRHILYVSGREDVYRPQTETFLRTHHCPPGPLWMRPTGDKRNDALVKLEIFNREIRHNYCIDFVLDDRDRVVKMWRALGLACFQVAEGNF